MLLSTSNTHVLEELATLLLFLFHQLSLRQPPCCNHFCLLHAANPPLAAEDVTWRGYNGQQPGVSAAVAVLHAYTPRMTLSIDTACFKRVGDVELMQCVGSCTVQARLVQRCAVCWLTDLLVTYVVACCRYLCLPDVCAQWLFFRPMQQGGLST
jgi:hypothetical protein